VIDIGCIRNRKPGSASRGGVFCEVRFMTAGNKQANVNAQRTLRRQQTAYRGREDSGCDAVQRDRDRGRALARQAQPAARDRDRCNANTQPGPSQRKSERHDKRRRTGNWQTE
jgi:hypothetical protein